MSILLAQQPTRADRLIGNILVRQGLRAEVLEQGLERQRTQGGLLGETLMAMKAITEDQLSKALAYQMDIPYLEDPRVEDVDPTLVEKLPVAFAKLQKVLPLRKDELDRVIVAISDPLAVHAVDDVRALIGLEATPVLVAPTKLLDLINKVFAKLKVGVELEEKKKGDEGDEFGNDAEELVDILDLTDEAPIIRWVNSLMFQAVKERASDIHIEPGEKDVVVRYRIDGVLRESKRANRQYAASILSRVKIMANLNIAEKRLPQDGRIRRKIAGKDIDMRVATAPIATGFERVTIRLLDRSSVLFGLADIGFAHDHQKTLEELINRPHGILLVTGPTGSGKTTTLYACLAKINSPDLNILTVEDPVEYQLEGISQTQVNPKIELTFASGLRSFLRHDPDVIMVGEIRDVETAEIAIQASLTGHLVLSTIHTNDAASGITRLVDMGVEPFLVASSLVGLLAQRLVRRVCAQCRVLHTPTAEEITALGMDAEQFFSGRIQFPRFKGALELPRGKVFRAKGCHACLETGYQGRSAIYELLMISDEIRSLALKKIDSTAIKRAAMAKGMRTLRMDGAYKVFAGITTIEEVMLVTTDDT
jgi:general secretion pathway protein E